MAIQGLFEGSVRLLGQGLDVALARQKVISGNIANIETPNYVPRDLDFATEMARASSEAQMGTSGAYAPTPIERPDRAAGADGNAVDLDVQMARLSQNGMLYSAQSRALSRQLAMLRYAASEGGS